jgi:hypothetical protein
LEGISLHQTLFRVGISVFLLVHAITLFAAEPDRLKPIVIVESPDKGFQSIMRGGLITEGFIIRNAGDSVLKFEGIEMSHSGMKIRVKQTVKAGDSVEAVVEWDTQGIAGDVEGIVVLLTNDPLQPRLHLSLKGRIIPPIQILPRPVFYISQFQGEQSETRFTIQNNQEKAVEIERVELLGDHFTAEVKTLEPGRKWSLTVTIPAATPSGRFREALKIHTDDEQHPSLYVQVNVMVKPDVFIDPETVDFGLVSQARILSNPQILEFMTQTIVIGRRDGDMTIKTVQADLPFISVEQEPEGASSGFRLDLKLNPELLKSGKFEGQITLITDDPEYSEIKIPVNGEVSE